MGRTENMQGWIISIIIHILAALAFISAKLELKPFNLDYTPVFFVPLTEIPPVANYDNASNSGSEPLVDLPRRPMLDETSPLLKLPDRHRPEVAIQSSSSKPDFSKQKSITPSKRVALNPLANAGRERASMESIPLSDEALFGQRKDAVSDQIANAEMFTITWESGPNRVKTAGSLPHFPGSVNREVKIRLAFTVAPDGSIVSITPQTKGEPELERVSVEALRTWRFNSLQGSSTVKQNGIITFVFELR